MRFGVLGPVEARAGEAAVPLGGPGVRALLAMLVLEAGRVVPAERLIDGMYGEEPPENAANALQSRVSRLRRALGDAVRVEGHPRGYRIAADPDDVDAHRFGRLAADGRRALAAGDAAGAARLLEEALGLWRGPALAGLDAPFASARATRLEEERASVAEDYGAAVLVGGDAADAVPVLRDLVDARPLRERARALLMRALHTCGRQAEALAVFEEGRRILAEELGADPSPELADAHVAILRGEARAPRARPPAPLTSFVGRDEELRLVGKMLAAGRLVTLLGPGGAGKTRLAVEAARREGGEVCFVDLAPVEAGDVPKALLGALGLRAAGMRATGMRAEPGTAADTEERLVTALDGRPTLLVLDNCEHVVEAVAGLAHRLLRACPELRVLATSREPLGITGEALRPVPPLELPPEDAPEAEIAGYPAVRLFLDRAEAARPGAAPDPATVVAVCRALDGLPLAIELAAARLRSLPLDQVAARLDDRFRLLSRGDRTAAPRHRTLRAVVEWSWDLLDERERVLARRLTVFSGGFTLEAAAGVCGLPDADDLVAGLADKSLLQADGSRYRMLDTVRAFCAERLAEAGETERFERAHAAYFLALARRADPHLRGPEQLRWLGTLAAEHGNLHAALRRSVRRDHATALRLTASLSWYWLLRGRTEGSSLASELVDAVGDPPPELGEEYVLCVANALSGGVTGERAQRWRERAAAVLERAGGPPAYPATLVLWAMITGPPAAGPSGPAGPGARYADAVLRAGDDPWTRSLISMASGFVALFRGDPAAAREACTEALRGFRACGDRWGMANCLDSLAQTAGLLGDRAGAFALLDEALELMERLGALEDTADLHYRRAELHLRAGDVDAARAGYERGLEPARRAGAPERIAAGYQGLGDAARLAGDAAGARRLYETALARCASGRFTAAEVRGSALVGLARLAAADGDRDRARDLFREALAASAHPIFPYQASAAAGLADAALARGDGESAARLLGLAAALRTGPAPRGPEAARVASGARGLLGDAVYEAVFAEAAALPRERAFALLTGG